MIWRTIWYPTLNVSYNGDLEEGVYKMNILHKKIIYSGMGTYFRKKELVEVHIFDQNIDLYGEELTIYPLAKVRDNQSFNDLASLVDQLKQDETTIRNIDRTVLTFGTFDYIHPGHISYLHQARNYWDALVTIISLDKTVKTIKWDIPDHSADDRLLWIQQIGIQNHTVQLWSGENVYQCLHDRKPDVICLGYDQNSFDAWIIKYCSRSNLNLPIIIRLDSYKEDVYKSSIIKKKF